MRPARRSRAAAAPDPVPDRYPSEAYRWDRLRLRHLRLLERIAHHGSLGSAARALGVSQPAGTLLLRELESVFGTQLVERGPRGGRLTPAGARALERLGVALAAISRAAEAARAPSPVPLLHVGCIQLVGSVLLPEVLAGLGRDGAAIRIALREGRALELMNALCGGELDCVIGWTDAAVLDAVPVGQLVLTPLWHGTMRVVAARGHPLARTRVGDVRALLGWPWIVPPPGSRTHAAFRRLFVQHGVEPPAVAVECAALHTMLHAVASSRHLAVAPDAVIDAYARLGTVAVLRGPALELGREPVSIAVRSDSADLPAVRDFRDRVLAVASKTQRGRALR